MAKTPKSSVILEISILKTVLPLDNLYSGNYNEFYIQLIVKPFFYYLCQVQLKLVWWSWRKCEFTDRRSEKLS